MEDLVKRTYEAATAWQQGVAWIRVNVAFIEAELPGVAKGGHKVDDIKALVDSFGPVYAQFCETEYRLFVVARRIDAEESPMRPFTDQLLRLRESFRDWTLQYHKAVERRRSQESDADDRDLATSLLLCCGGEIHQAHTAFIECVDDFAGQLKAAARTKTKE